MRDFMIRPTPWRLIALAAFTGVLLSLQNYGMFTIFPETTPYWVLPLFIISYTTLLIIINVVQRKKLEPWVFPALGGLLWELWWLFSIWEQRRAPFFFDLVLTTFTIVGLIIIYKRRRVVSISVMVLSGVIVVAIGLLEFFRTSANLDFTSSVLISLLNLVVHSVPILAFGLLFAQEYRSTAVLLVAVYEPFFIEKYLADNISYKIWTSHLLETQIAIVMFRIIPFLIFLILMPVFALRSQTPRTQEWFLGLISFVVIGSMAFIRVAYLQDPDILFSLSPWAMWAHFLIVLWSPILLAILLYRNCQQIVPAS